jgi:hypothetical protein
MSYEIIYAKSFIKISKDECIPYFLMGSNNVYESYPSGMRHRTWQVWRAFNEGRKMIINNFNLIKSIDNELLAVYDRYKDENTKDDIEKRWGWFTSLAKHGFHTSQLSFKTFKNIFKIGIENALTIEEYLSEDVYFTLYLKNWDEDKNPIELLPALPITSTEILIKNIPIYENYANLHNLSLYLGNNGLDWYLEKNKIRKRNAKNSKPKNEIKQNYFYVLTHNVNNHYLIRFLKYGYRYSNHSVNAKKFQNEKLAERFLKTSKYPLAFKIECIEQETVFTV